MLNLKNKILTKSISLLLAQVFLLTSLAYPESSANKNISSLYIQAKHLRVPMGFSKIKSQAKDTEPGSDGRLAERMLAGFDRKAFKEGELFYLGDKPVSLERLTPLAEALELSLEEIYDKDLNPQEIEDKALLKRGLAIDAGDYGLDHPEERLLDIVIKDDLGGAVARINIAPLKLRNGKSFDKKAVFMQWFSIDRAWMRRKGVSGQTLYLALSKLLYELGYKEIYGTRRQGSEGFWKSMRWESSSTEIYNIASNLKEAGFYIEKPDSVKEGHYPAIAGLYRGILASPDKSITSKNLASNQGITRRDFLLAAAGVSATVAGGGILYKSGEPSVEEKQEAARLKKPMHAKKYASRIQFEREKEDFIAARTAENNILSADDTRRVRGFLTPARIKAIEFAAKAWGLEPALISGFAYEEQVDKKSKNKIKEGIGEHFSKILGFRDMRNTIGLMNVSAVFMKHEEFLEFLYENEDFIMNQLLDNEADRSKFMKFIEGYKFIRQITKKGHVWDAWLETMYPTLNDLADNVEPINILLGAYAMRIKSGEIAVRNRKEKRLPEISKMTEDSNKWLVKDYKEIPAGLQERYSIFNSSYYPPYAYHYFLAVGYAGIKIARERALAKMNAYIMFAKSSVFATPATDRFKIKDSVYTVGAFNVNREKLGQKLASNSNIGSTMLSSEITEGLKKAGGEAIRQFYAGLAEYLDNPESSPYKDISSQFWDIAKGFKENPDVLSDKRLLNWTESDLARIEVRGYNKETGESDQVVIRGIPDEYRRPYLEALKKQFPVSIKKAGLRTLEANAMGIDKALSIDYLNRHFEEILDAAGYMPGQFIDARRTRTVIVADGDGTTYGKSELTRYPTLDESAAKNFLVDYLEAGGAYVVISGNDLDRTRKRLLLRGAIPPHLWSRIIIFANGSSSLDTLSNSGELVEFQGYRLNAIKESKENPQDLSLDAVYIGDDPDPDGNDFAAFKKAGAERAICVSSEAIDIIHKGLRDNYIGGEEKGTAAFLQAVVEHVKRFPNQLIFTDGAIPSLIQSARFNKDVEKKLDALRERWKSEPETFTAVRTQDGVDKILKWMEKDPGCFIGAGDMSKIAVINYVFTMKIVDKLIPIMIGAADFVLSEYNGSAVRTGGDELCIVLPSDLSMEDVNRIRLETQQILAYFIDGKYSFTKIEDMSDEGMNSLNNTLRSETNDPLVGAYKDRDGFFIIYDRSNLTSSLTGLLRPGSLIFSLPSPRISFGIVRSEKRDKDVHANYGRSKEHAEYILRVSKENGLNGAASEMLAGAGLDKFESVTPAIPKLSDEDKAGIAGKYTKLGIQLFVDDIEPYYPVVRKEKLYDVLKKMSSAGIGTTINIRSPPDGTYIANREDYEIIGFMKLDFVYQPYGDLKKEVDKAIETGRFTARDLRWRQDGYGFKLLNEFRGTSANRVILGINNLLNQMLETQQTLDGAFADTIGEGVNAMLQEEKVQASVKVILNVIPIHINDEQKTHEKAMEDMDYLAKLDILNVPGQQLSTVTTGGNIFQKKMPEHNEMFNSLTKAQREEERKYFSDILNQTYSKPALNNSDMASLFKPVENNITRLLQAQSSLREAI